MRRLAWAIVLAGVYVVVLGAWGPDAWLVGFLLGLGVTTISRRRSAPRTNGRPILWSPWFVLGAVREVARGAWRMLRVMPRRRSRTRVVEVPIDGRSDEGVALSGLIATATPGSILIDVDRARGVLRFDEIEPVDPAEACEDHQRFYRDHQSRVLP